MTSIWVPTIQTTLTKEQFLYAVLDERPELSIAQVGILWAQHAVECTDGKNCYGWNFGNVKHVSNDGHNYQILHGVTEFVNGKEILISPDDPSARFCAFATCKEGMQHYLGMFSHGRYASCWDLVLDADPTGFARMLGACGWYSAPPDKYASAMRVKYGIWNNTSFSNPAPTTPKIPDQIKTDPPESDQDIVHQSPYPDEE